MSGLPWVRLDTGFPSHPKILELLADASAPAARRYQAVVSYASAICWCGDHGTDGHIPVTALPFIHGSPATASLLVRHRLWDPRPGGGWFLPNYALRQELAVVTEAKKQAQRIGGLKGACARWHPPGCGCWRDAV